jgi:4'-phosphopantetheinyl transferase
MIEPSEIQTEWQYATTPLSMRPQVVDIWRIHLDCAARESMDWLSSNELSRADKYYNEEDRHQWIASRCGLRQILSGYLGIEPGAVKFAQLEHGKPILFGDIFVNKRFYDGSDGMLPRVEFNLSHTSGIAMIAVTIGNPIGVDVEFLDRNLDPAELAPTVFSSDEVAAVLSARAEDRLSRFLEIWTMKEAWLKMIGCGLTEDLPTLSVRNYTRLPRELRPAQLMSIDIGESYKAAVSVQRDAPLIRKYDLMSL